MRTEPNDPNEFESLKLTRGSVARFLTKYRIGVSIPYRVIYQTYMSSPEWRERREAFFSTHAKACRACGNGEDIHLHHQTYERFTEEADDDLVPLCETCHQWVHHLHRSTQLTLPAATQGVVDARRTDAEPRNWERPPARGKGSAMDAFFAAARVQDAVRPWS